MKISPFGEIFNLSRLFQAGSQFLRIKVTRLDAKWCKYCAATSRRKIFLRKILGSIFFRNFVGYTKVVPEKYKIFRRKNFSRE